MGKGYELDASFCGIPDQIGVIAYQIDSLGIPLLDNP